MAKPTRRRFMSIVAASLGGLAAGRVAASPRRRRIQWRGVAMGASASIVLYHRDPELAAAAIRHVVGEIDRLENIFSLYRPHSALTRLNRNGELPSPPRELVDLLDRARRVSKISAGAFDVTVQPLWRLYADHFAVAGADRDGPSAALIDTARSLVDWRRLSVSPERVRFGRAGMAVTLNGAAQGYVTDRAAEILGGYGLGDVLIDLGEFRALGLHPGGRPWSVGLENPVAGGPPLDAVRLADRAIATSGGYGTALDAAGRFHHLFDPKAGAPSASWAQVSVVADTATTADMLSTAIAVAPPRRAAGILAAGGGRRGVLVTPSGAVRQIDG